MSKRVRRLDCRPRDRALATPPVDVEGVVLVMDVQLRRNQGFPWTHRGGTSVKGFIHATGTVLRDESLCSHFGSAKPIDEFERLFASANGSFCVVAEIQGAIVAAVDRVRSFPLFYSAPLNLITDDLTKAPALGALDVDKRAVEQFLLSGHTVGPRTLLEGAQQLQAGQVLVTGPAGTEVRYYYRHQRTEAGASYDEPPHDDLVALSDRSFRRLIDSCDGRQIVLSLSGGYDSRYIAVMLKRLEYDNVMCFSYGRPESFEVQTSRRVAAKLGFRWEFVPYTRDRWRALVADDRYLQFASSLASLPSCQGYPSVAHLVTHGAVESDAVFVPGYCGDLLGGSYVPTELAGSNSEGYLREPIARYIVRRHFPLRGPNAGSVALVEDVEKEVAVDARPSIRSYISTNEEFFTRHKVARFVVNAVREYEYFGHQWRMPLWDTELTDFWYAVDDAHRVDSTMHRGFLQSVFRQYGVHYAKGGTAELQKRVSRGRISGVAYRILKPALKAISRRFLRNRIADFNAFSEFELLLVSHGRQLASIHATNVNTRFAAWFVNQRRGEFFAEHSASTILREQ